MKPSTRTSYFVIVIVMALVVYLHFGTFLLTSFFGYLALQVLTIRESKWLSVALYLIVVAVIGAGLVYFSFRHQALRSDDCSCIPILFPCSILA